MNPELASLSLTLINYRKALEEVKIVSSDDAEYYGWMSLVISSDQWPTGGDFVKARKDEKFRKFREVMKELSNMLDLFNFGFFPQYIRKSYVERFRKEYPDAIPF